MQNLLTTRWKERDLALGERFLQVANQMAGRGMLHSTVMVQAMYRVACDEFVGSRQTIVSTTIDSLMAGTVKLNRDELVQLAMSNLKIRQESIARQFRERAGASGMLNSGTLQGHVDLSSKTEGAVNELRVELIRALDDYQSKNAGNLKDKILHRLLDVPEVAWFFIAFIVVAALVSLVSDIVNLFGRL